VLTPPPPVVIQICDIYISAAQREVKVPVTETRVQFIRTACQNDLTLSSDLLVKYILYIDLKSFSFIFSWLKQLPFI
jgi:hypothetical protein